MNAFAQICRNGRVTELTVRRQQLCDKYRFNVRTHMCCQGVVHQRRLGQKCCQPGTNIYNPSSQTCCNGQVFDERPQTSFRYCTGSIE